MPAHSQKSARVRSARTAGRNGRFLRRPRASRSRRPRAKGTIPTTRASRTVQPLTERSSKNTVAGVRNAAPAVASIEPTSASVARPSWPRRRSESPPARPEASADVPSWVVSEIAATPSATNGPCSSAAKGMPRSTSCVGTKGIAGVCPVCSEMRAEAVPTRVGAGECDPSPASAMRGRPSVPRSSRTIAASACWACADVRAKWTAPAPPYAPASVEIRMSVRLGSGAGPASWGANPRASSMSAAVPDALSPFRRPAPVLSRWATRMMASSERPAITVSMFRSSTSPRSTRSALHTSSSVSSPSLAIVSEYQRAAFAASSVPGTREGNSVESSSATAIAADASNTGSRRGRGKAPVGESENKRASTTGASTSELTPTRRVLRGLSTVPRRARRLRPRGRAASIAALV